MRDRTVALLCASPGKSASTRRPPLSEAPVCVEGSEWIRHAQISVSGRRRGGQGVCFRSPSESAELQSTPYPDRGFLSQAASRGSAASRPNSQHASRPVMAASLRGSAVSGSSVNVCVRACVCVCLTSLSPSLPLLLRFLGPSCRSCPPLLPTGHSRKAPPPGDSRAGRGELLTGWPAATPGGGTGEPWRWQCLHLIFKNGFYLKVILFFNF